MIEYTSSLKGRCFEVGLQALNWELLHLTSSEKEPYNYIFQSFDFSIKVILSSWKEFISVLSFFIFMY